MIVTSLKKENWLPYQLRLVWLWGLSWADLRSCIAQSRLAFGALMEGLPFAVRKCFSLLFLYLFYLPIFFLHQKFRAAFSCENTCQTRMITVSFPSLYYTF